ncbi:MAG: IPT/TIG domain-containing protein, partial [Clostridia bacterium]|nr:IPT/TIG domain-containing protein [Clostridia bacterium]
DHLPARDFTADMLTTENLYASHYIVWNNFSKEIEAPNLQAYRLSANLLRQMGIGGGIISRYHQSYPLDVDDEAYFSRLEILEYDMLFGDHSAYNGEMPYEPTDLQFGSQPIEITSASQAYGRLLVTGKNFTEYSKIIVDGTAVDTAFVTDRQIIAIVPRTPAVAQVEVAQIANDGTELSRTAVYEMDQ